MVQDILIEDTSELKEMVRADFDKDPGSMTVMLAKKYKVPEAEILKVMPDEKCRELDGSRWMELVRQFEGMGKLFVLVTSKAAVMECQGDFGGFSDTMGFFNVQTDTLDMHIWKDRIGPVFAMKKASHMDGVETLSFLFYDVDGASGFKVFLTFGGDPPSDEVRAKFESLCEEFTR